MLPKDPFILFSYINTQLRDRSPSLEALCEEEGVSPGTLIARLAAVGFRYDRTQNQFR